VPVPFTAGPGGIVADGALALGQAVLGTESESGDEGLESGVAAADARRCRTEPVRAEDVRAGQGELQQAEVPGNSYPRLRGRLADAGTTRQRRGPIRLRPSKDSVRASGQAWGSAGPGGFSRSAARVAWFALSLGRTDVSNTCSSELYDTRSNISSYFGVVIMGKNAESGQPCWFMLY
jgi:hypothetical protein